MPQQSENVVDATVTEKSAVPIVDDPATLDEIYKSAGLEPPEKQPEVAKEQPWEKAVSDIAEGHKALQERIGELADAVAQGLTRPATERVIEREPSRPQPPVPKWRQSLKDEQADLLQDAIKDTVSGILREYETTQLGPTLGYILRHQEALVEAQLAGKYPDEDFGFGALAQDAKAYRQALGNSIDLENAYRHIAFEKTNQALMKVRQQTLDAARKVKAEHPMDDTTVGRTSADTDTSIEADELRVARAFFGGVDQKSGKPRSDAEIAALWVAHRKGAERDKNPFLDIDEEPRRR